MEVVEPRRWVLKTWLARALLPKQVNSIEPKGLQSKRIQVIPDDYGGPLEKGTVNQKMTLHHCSFCSCYSIILTISMP